jgi:hypothetical protein
VAAGTCPDYDAATVQDSLLNLGRQKRLRFYFREKDQDCIKEQRSRIDICIQ